VNRDEEIDKARRALEDARKKLTGNAGAEDAYAAAYARLVALGAALPLRRKYR
jgi:hypothetical protein